VIVLIRKREWRELTPEELHVQDGRSAFQFVPQDQREEGATHTAASAGVRLLNLRAGTSATAGSVHCL
jgi:hypothetical protein